MRWQTSNPPYPPSAHRLSGSPPLFDVDDPLLRLCLCAQVIPSARGYSRECVAPKQNALGRPCPQADSRQSSRHSARLAPPTVSPLLFQPSSSHPRLQPPHYISKYQAAALLGPSFLPHPLPAGVAPQCSQHAPRSRRSSRLSRVPTSQLEAQQYRWCGRRYYKTTTPSAAASHHPASRRKVN